MYGSSVAGSLKSTCTCVGTVQQCNGKEGGGEFTAVLGYCDVLSLSVKLPLHPLARLMQEQCKKVLEFLSASLKVLTPLEGSRVHHYDCRWLSVSLILVLTAASCCERAGRGKHLEVMIHTYFVFLLTLLNVISEKKIKTTI